MGRLYPSPGYVNEVIYMYLARGLSFGETDMDEDEFLNIVKLPFDKVLDMIMQGEIRDSKTQTAVLKTAVLLKKLK